MQEARQRVTRKSAIIVLMQQSSTNRVRIWVGRVLFDGGETARMAECAGRRRAVRAPQILCDERRSRYTCPIRSQVQAHLRNNKQSAPLSVSRSLLSGRGATVAEEETLWNQARSLEGRGFRRADG